MISRIKSRSQRWVRQTHQQLHWMKHSSRRKESSRRLSKLHKSRWVTHMRNRAILASRRVPSMRISWTKCLWVSLAIGRPPRVKSDLLIHKASTPKLTHQSAPSPSTPASVGPLNTTVRVLLMVHEPSVQPNPRLSLLLSLTQSTCKSTQYRSPTTILLPSTVAKPQRT